MSQHLPMGALPFGRMLPMAKQSDCTLKHRTINPSTKTNLPATHAPFLFCVASMAALKTLGSSLVVVVASILFCASARAEDGTLVVHVTDIHTQPVVGVSLRAGAG